MQTPRSILSVFAGHYKEPQDSYKNFVLGKVGYENYLLIHSLLTKNYFCYWGGTPYFLMFIWIQ